MKGDIFDTGGDRSEEVLTSLGADVIQTAGMQTAEEKGEVGMYEKAVDEDKRRTRLPDGVPGI